LRAEAVGLDFGGMERVVTKFHDRTGQRRDSDVIWRLPNLDGPEIYLHLLLEVQSSSTPSVGHPYIGTSISICRAA